MACNRYQLMKAGRNLKKFITIGVVIYLYNFYHTFKLW